jgi:PIN domain nuclease of toxin-antitoxin system
LDAPGITVSPFRRLDARLAASCYRQRSGLNLADRVCLALARGLSGPAYTTDRLGSTEPTTSASTVSASADRHNHPSVRSHQA